MGNKRTNFLIQGSILAIASLISRAIGLIYRIPMTAIIGDGGNDYYSTAYEIYNVFLLISSYSLPIAVSKLVSARISKKERKNAFKLFKGALIFALITGGVCMVIILFGAGFITAKMQTPLAVFALQILAPTVLIVAVLGTIRGFFQGLGTMVPSATSQVIEQIVNAGISIIASYILFNHGMKTGALLGNAQNYAEAYGAAGGTLGTCAGALVGLFFVSFLLFAFLPSFRRLMRRDNKTVEEESMVGVMKVILLTVVPVLLSTTIYNISAIIDQAIFKNIATHQGYAAQDIKVWWGVFSGKYKLLINVPIAIASALAASTVPALTEAFVRRDIKEVREKIYLGMRFISIIALPFTVGFIVLASPVMQLLFNDARELPAFLMQIGAVAVVFYSLSTLSNAILQGINRLRVPVTNAIIALGIHIVFLVVLMYGFKLTIEAVVLANAFYALLMCILNNLAIRRYSGYRQELRLTFVIPGICSVLMGVVTFLVYKGIDLILLKLFSGTFVANAIAVIVSTLVSIVVYFVLLILLKGITEEMLLRFPKGASIVRLCRKFRLLR